VWLMTTFLAQMSGLPDARVNDIVSHCSRLAVNAGLLLVTGGDRSLD